MPARPRLPRPVKPPRGPALPDAARTGIETATFRPFFWIDEDQRVCCWPELTARHTRIAPDRALGNRCWEVVHGLSRLRRLPCSAACLAGQPRAGTPPPPSWPGDDMRCGALSLGGATGTTLVWYPFARSVVASPFEALQEELLVDGCLAMHVGSLPALVDAVRRVSAADDCEVFLRDARKGEVFLVDCEGFDRDAFLERTRIPLGQGYPGLVTARQTPLFTNDFQNDRTFLRDGVRRCGIRSFLGVPLSDGSALTGYLGLGWRDPRVPVNWVLRLLQRARPMLAAALATEMGGARGSAAVVRRTGPVLRVRCFGRFEVERDGVPIPTERFTRRKAVQLLGILILRQGNPISTDALVELLWPGCDPHAGANRLHAALHALRQAIEPERPRRRAAWVRMRERGYVLDPDAPLEVDLHRFRDLLEHLRRHRSRGATPEQLAPLLEEAFTLYRGDLFAADADEAIFANQRTALREQYLEVARSLAGVRLGWQRPQEAVACLRTTLAVAGPCESTHRLLIEALLQCGRRPDAAHEFEQCLRTLREDLNARPAPETLALGARL